MSIFLTFSPQVGTGSGRVLFVYVVSDNCLQGPELMTCGIYRPIMLTTYCVCINDMACRAFVNDDLSCSLKVNVGVSGDTSEIGTYQTVLKDLRGNIIKSESISVQGDVKLNTTTVDWTFEEDQVRLWWPVGYGEQAMYTVELGLLDKVGIPTI